jgi:hypothetical protein
MPRYKIRAATFYEFQAYLITYIAHLHMGAIEQSLDRSTEAIKYYKEVFDADPLSTKA